MELCSRPAGECSSPSMPIDDDDDDGLALAAAADQTVIE